MTDPMPWVDSAGNRHATREEAHAAEPSREPRMTCFWEARYAPRASDDVLLDRSPHGSAGSTGSRTDGRWVVPCGRWPRMNV